MNEGGHLLLYLKAILFFIILFILLLGYWSFSSFLELCVREIATSTLINLHIHFSVLSFVF